MHNRASELASTHDGTPSCAPQPCVAGVKTRTRTIDRALTHDRAPHFKTSFLSPPRPVPTRLSLRSLLIFTLPHCRSKPLSLPPAMPPVKPPVPALPLPLVFHLSLLTSPSLLLTPKSNPHSIFLPFLGLYWVCAWPYCAIGCFFGASQALVRMIWVFLGRNHHGFQETVEVNCRLH